LSSDWYSTCVSCSIVLQVLPSAACREVGVLVVVDEDEVEGSVGEAERAAQPFDGRSAVAERPHDHGQPVAHARVSPDAAGDLGVRRAELDPGRA